LKTAEKAELTSNSSLQVPGTGLLRRLRAV
jgi:hypothetical protein